MGKGSTYFIRVGRSLDIRGPYVDKVGKDLLKGGGTLFMGIDPATNPQGRAAQQTREIGPGHVGIFTGSDDIDRVTYHYYDGNTPNGAPTLGLGTIVWDTDEWPQPRS
jgi:arabinan endo-1,5-alpha-L-arabinosidase